MAGVGSKAWFGDADRPAIVGSGIGADYSQAVVSLKVEDVVEYFANMRETSRA